MKLSNRLLLLLLICLAPIAGIQAHTLLDLYRDRHAEIGVLALRDARLIEGEIGNIAAGARQLATVASRLPAVRDRLPACGSQLAVLGDDLPPFRFIAVYDAHGAAVCASLPGLVEREPAPAWLADLQLNGATATGHLTNSPAVKGAFLPVAVPSPEHGWVVVALDLGWLSRHLTDLKMIPAPAMAGSTVLVTDRDGNLLARSHATQAWPGAEVLQQLLPLTGRPAADILPLRGNGEPDRLAAYVPAAESRLGIGAIVVLDPAPLTHALTSAAWREGVVFALCALLALGLTYLAGHSFVFRPTEALLAAARRWQDGDLDARAEVPEPKSEFGILAKSFNSLVSTLQARDQERRQQAGALEAQVAERTQALSQTNNRLQVEIAEREKTEAALLQSQKLQAVGQLAGGIAHDFNNMLATILGSLELMERRLPAGGQTWTEIDAERLRTLIERATAAVQRGAHLTSRMLAFSRRQRLSPRPTDLTRLVTDLITLATSTLGRRVRVVTNLTEDIWPALADPSQVEAAILNLCLNARDAMPEGGQLTITTGNETIIRRPGPDDPEPGQYVRVTVADTGTGMTPEVLSRALEPFFTTKGVGGSGLGLSQVYGMARQLGGAVRISSTPGAGTAVSLLLPRAAEAAQQDRAAGAGTAIRHPLPSSLVLVVDDDAAVRQVAVEMLRDLGCHVVEAPGGEEALVLLDGAARGASLALIDYAMPGMNGLELARAIRARPLAMPLVLATGYADLAEGGAALFDGMLRKPFTIRELEAMVVRMRTARPSSNVVLLRGQRLG